MGGFCAVFGHAWMERIVSEWIARFFELDTKLVDFGHLVVEVFANGCEGGLGVFEFGERGGQSRLQADNLLGIVLDCPIFI